jgi:hypothetical protein
LRTSATWTTRRAYQSAVEGHGFPGVKALAEAYGEAVLEHLIALVHQPHGEHLEIDDAAHQLAYALEQGIDVEDGGKLAADFVEHFECLRLARDAGVQAGVFDGLSDAGGGELQQPEVLGREVIRLFGLDVDDADDAILDNQRNSQLGAHSRVGVDVILGLADIVDENGLALLSHLSHHSLTELDPHTLDLRRVADLEAHAQIAGAVVEKQDGEDAVVDDGANQVGRALEQGL